MASHTIVVTIEKKRVYAYLTIINYGWVEDEDYPDPWEIVPNPSGKKYITTYRFPKTELPHFEEYFKRYFSKHRAYYEWETLEQALGKDLSGTFSPYEQIKYHFTFGKCTYECVGSKAVEL